MEVRRTGPPESVRPDGGPVQIHRFRCPHPSHSRLEPTGSCVSSASRFLESRSRYYQEHRKPASLLRSRHWLDRLIRGRPPGAPAPSDRTASPRDTRLHVPRSQRLRRRRYAPSSGFHSDRPSDAWPGRLVSSESLSLTASRPRRVQWLGKGMHFAAAAAPVLANPPPTPTLAHGTYCPPLAVQVTRPARPAQAPPAKRLNVNIYHHIDR